MRPVLRKGCGAYIRKKREELGISCQTLASRIGLTKGFISLLETGKCGIDEVNAIRLADVLGIDVSEIIECTDSVMHVDPAWLRFLSDAYDLTEDDKRVLQEIVKNTGMPLTISGETNGEYKGRWRRFYNEVKKFLSEPKNRFFADLDVQYILSRLGVPDATDLNDVREAFLSKVNAICGSAERCVTMDDWKAQVCHKVGIKIIDVAKVEHRDYSRINYERIGLSKIMVESSNKIYGLSCKLYPAGSGYAFICDTSGEKGLRLDYPFWHEAARILVDPELQSGKSVTYIADGVQRLPIESLLGRMAVWLAYHFPIAESILHKMVDRHDLAIPDIHRVNVEVFKGATLRMTAMALAEACDRPLVYIDAQMRLKEAECCAAKIGITDKTKMEKHPDAKLRIGFGFKNCVADSYGVELRYNMQIGEKSPILVAFRNKTDFSGEESLSDWASRYNLVGYCTTTASYSYRTNNVRAFMMFKTD